MIKSRKGMYIVEAAVVMPVFILAMALLIWIIPVVDTCENIVFSCADELRLDSAKAALINEDLSLRVVLGPRVLSENKDLSSFVIEDFRKKYSKSGIDDLMTLDFTATFRKSTPLISIGATRLKGRLTSRAFTGSTHKVSGEGSDDIVYIFPEDGVRYHNRSCRYLSSHCRMTYLSQDIQRDYHACPLCSAKSAGPGDPVFYFPSSGEAYHTNECRSIEKEKYYVETTVSAALDSGYTACSVCGG